MPNTYTLLNHTADLKIRVNGTDPADLFKNAGLALFDQITMPDRLEPRDEVELSVAGDDRADLMVNFLRELLYLWTGKEQLVKTIDIAQISATTVSARVSMERYQPERHEIIHEIKAITYHQIEVSRTAEGWQAMVVFDV
jgi:SHS2 domain-containing protein